MTDVAAVMPDLATAIGYLFTAYRKPLGDVTGRVYEHQLADVPLALVAEVILAAPTRHQWLPSIAELKADCEALRLARRAAVVWTPCVACRDRRPGWDVVVDPAGDARYTRCACWTAHQARVAALGLPTAPILKALPAGDGAHEEIA